ncbi:FadR/GntR family transcriptional regulator [Aneurinibacillus tyrosinisolvens]|uniref:FadR/GntR family transcriptional regulator n=1 Tax=Aneurinibacillus tyrosinisolvens TaxID=1443435 RepID=UPI00063F0060|nr:FadR/GntR family transcriptional regulator [Aneurinibacillus tyrosinisolvens]
MVPIKRLEQNQRTEEVVQKIKEFVLTGELKPGDQFLAERELAKQLSVSRSSLREGLKVLSGMGLIEITPRGTYVKKAELGDVMEPLMMVMSQNVEDVFMLLEARKILESEAARLAAIRADDVNLAVLRELTERLKKETEAGIFTEEADLNFHSQIVILSKNKVLIHLMHVVESLVKTHYVTIREKMMSKVAETFSMQHINIYEAINARDPELAAFHVKEHIDFTIEQLLQLTDIQANKF